MAGLVFVAVLAAAGMHATWNAIAKLVPDHRVSAGLLAVAGVAAGAAAAVVLPPPDPAAWPYLGLSALLHAVYFLALVRAYRDGEFGRVYPLARGTAPPLVALVSWGWLGERLTAGQLAGVAVVSAALAGLVVTRGGGRLQPDQQEAGAPVRPGTAPGVSVGPTRLETPPPLPAGPVRPWLAPGFAPAAVTGVVIAAYTLVDGVGVRLSGHALGYAGWLFLVQGWLVIAATRLSYGRGFTAAMRRSAPAGLLGGVLALVAYGVVLWAQTRAPLGLVATLRETSVLFAGVLGTLVFKERLTAVRTVATVAAVVGLVLLQSA